MEEIWKDIIGYEGWYQISNLGRVKSLRRKRVKKGGGYIVIEKEVIRKWHGQTNGYYGLMLHRDSVKQNFLIHRLVANHFVKKRKNKKANQVNHIDGNKANNAASNLEWVTASENMQHAHDNNLMYVSRRKDN